MEDEDKEDKGRKRRRKLGPSTRTGRTVSVLGYDR